MVPGSFPTSKSGLSEVGSINGEVDELASLRLVRQTSTNSNSFISGGKGYLFLAVVFCMMCCSSLLTAPKAAMDHVTKAVSGSNPAATGSSGSAKTFGRVGGQRKLMSNHRNADQASYE